MTDLEFRAELRKRCRQAATNVLTQLEGIPANTVDVLLRVGNLELHDRLTNEVEKALLGEISCPVCSALVPPNEVWDNCKGCSQCVVALADGD